MNNLKKDAAKATCISCGNKVNPKSFFRTMGSMYFCCEDCLKKWDIKNEKNGISITLKEREGYQ
jgi:hypothetical protein